VDGNIRLSATVISYTGKDEEKDDFYFNGNFSNCHNTESVQCSFEKACNNYVFAVSDSIGMNYEGETGISAIREIKKYHENAKTQQFSLESITEKIYEAVQLSSNLIYSQSVISNLNTSALTGFSSVIIDNNRAILMNLGNNGAFLYRNGQQKDVFEGNDSKKNQKLKMLGISPNSTEIYNDTGKILKLAEEESKTKVKISSSFEILEGDILLLCSDGLLNAVGKSRIEAVINSGFDPSKMASILFQEAVKNFNGNGITIMALRVDEIKNNVIDFAGRSLNQVSFENEPEEGEEESGSGKSIVNYILAFICIIVISGVLFMGYLIIKNRDFLGSDRPAADTSQTSLNTGEAANTLSTAAESSASTSEANTSVQSADSSQNLTEPDTQNTENGSKQNNGAAKDNTQKSNTGSSKNSDTAKDNGNTETGSNQNDNSEYDIHIVKSGDTLSSISSKYYGKPNNYDVIIKYNNLKNENSLYINQELKIPKLKK